MYEAIVQSLIEHTGHHQPSMQNIIESEEEQRILKEVMQMSKLEEDRKKGQLDLTKIKRKNKPVEIKEKVGLK